MKATEPEPVDRRVRDARKRAPCLRYRPGVGDSEHTDPASVARRSFAWARRHPVISGTFVACIALGAVLGLTLLSGEWSPLRRLLAGSIAGASTALLITATKLFG